MKERPIGYLEPFEGESISHYLGRYRRQSVVSVSSAMTLGLKTECGSIFHRWERFFFNPRPTAEEIDLVSQVLGLTEDELIKILPDQNESIVIEPVRLCAACYREKPWHHMIWQFKTFQCCEKHKLQLLISCPGCHKAFESPKCWIVPMLCKTCGFKFSRMKKKQKVVFQ